MKESTIIIACRKSLQGNLIESVLCPFLSVCYSCLFFFASILWAAKCEHFHNIYRILWFQLELMRKFTTFSIRRLSCFFHWTAWLAFWTCFIYDRKQFRLAPNWSGIAWNLIDFCHSFKWKYSEMFNGNYLISCLFWTNAFFPFSSFLWNNFVIKTHSTLLEFNPWEIPCHKQCSQSKITILMVFSQSMKINTVEKSLNSPKWILNRCQSVCFVFRVFIRFGFLR